MQLIAPGLGGGKTDQDRLIGWVRLSQMVRMAHGWVRGCDGRVSRPMNTFARVASSDVSDTVRIKVISGFALTVSHATTKLI
jgi:hypothetical protein